MNIAAIKAERERDAHRIVDDMEEPIAAIRRLLPIAHGMLEPAPGGETNPKGATDILRAAFLLVERLEEERTAALARLHASERAAA